MDPQKPRRELKWSDLPDRLQRSVLAGEPGALAELAVWLGRTRPPWVDEDTLQSVLADLIGLLARHREEFMQIKSLPGLLSRMARNRRIDDGRRRKARSRRERAAAVPVRIESDVLACMIREDLCAKVREALGRLDPVQRAALIRRDVEGASYPEITSEIWQKVGPVWSKKLSVLLSRSRSRFRRFLGRPDA